MVWHHSAEARGTVSIEGVGMLQIEEACTVGTAGTCHWVRPNGRHVSRTCPMRYRPLRRITNQGEAAGDIAWLYTQHFCVQRVLQLQLLSPGAPALLRKDSNVPPLLRQSWPTVSLLLTVVKGRLHSESGRHVTQNLLGITSVASPFQSQQARGTLPYPPTHTIRLPSGALWSRWEE